jgi:hypothetical protein
MGVDWLQHAAEQISNFMSEHTSQRVTYVRNVGASVSTPLMTPLTFKQMQKHSGERGFKMEHGVGVSLNCTGFVVDREELGFEPGHGDLIHLELSDLPSSYEVVQMPDGEPFNYFDPYKKQYIVSVIERT